jgi:hypothetical protein
MSDNMKPSPGEELLTVKPVQVTVGPFDFTDRVAVEPATMIELTE